MSPTAPRRPPTRRLPTRRLLTRRLRHRELLAVDLTVAVGLALLCWYAATAHPYPGEPGLREPAWLSALAGLLIGAPLVVRRRWPVPVAGVVVAGSVAALLSGVIPYFASVAPAMAVGAALYLVGLAVPGRRSVAVLAGCLTLVVGAVVIMATNILADVAGFSFVCLLIAGAWVVGVGVRERRAHAAQAAEQSTEQAVSDERLRLAREMHDIVAHSMSLIAVKAAIANHVAEVEPQESRDALRVIEATSRDALRDMRRALGVLREEAAYAPTPGLADLAGLADHAASCGVRVELDVTAGVPLPEAVGGSVFRIVQEALTNVVRHAAPARCRVTVAVDPEEVRIEVTDDGQRPSTPSPGGHGLIGVRERVAMYGGDVSAGPRPGGGFTVTARLPYGPTA